MTNLGRIHHNFNISDTLPIMIYDESKKEITKNFKDFDCIFDACAIGQYLGGIKNKYDFIIIDCSPSLGIVTINSLVASDSVIIPIQCEYFALEGLSQLLQTIRLVQRHLNKKLDIEGVLITMYDGRLNLSKQVENEVRGYFKDSTFKTTIRRNVRLGEAPSFGKPILLYEANSSGAQDYLTLVEEMLERDRKTSG